MKRQVFSLVFILPLLLGFSYFFEKKEAPRESAFSEETIIDQRTQQVYKIVTIGTQKWFAQNLAYPSPKSICFKKKKKNCEAHGRLYPYDEIATVCPKGWRVPDVKDWENLKNNFSENDLYDLMDTKGWEKSNKHKNTSRLSLQGSGYQFKKRLFIGARKATTIWINEMNDYAEYFHAHIYGGAGAFFEATQFQTNEVFHAHPIEDLPSRKFSIRCMCDKNSKD